MSDIPSGDQAAAAAAGEEAQPQFALQKLFLKDLSFESPNAPDVFRRQWKPKIKLDLNSRFQRLEDDVFEVVLTLSVEARGEDDKVGFIVELQQAGIFAIAGLPDDQLQQMLASYCPNLLFPYARETIDSLVLKGSFPALMLAPVNFDALYAEALKRRTEQAAGAAASGTGTGTGTGSDVTH